MTNNFERIKVEKATAERLKIFLDDLNVVQKEDFFKLYITTLGLLVPQSTFERICNYYKEIE